MNSATLGDLPESFDLEWLKEGTISLKSRQQGFRYYYESYFHNVEMNWSGNHIQISAKCYPSQRKGNPAHRVHLEIHPDERKISDVMCSCQAGQCGSCSHVIGLILALHMWQLHGFKEVPGYLSSTSMPQQWGKPRGGKIKSVAVAELTIINPRPDRKRKAVCNSLTDNRKIRVEQEDITKLKASGLPIGYLVSQPALQVDTFLGSVPVGSGLATHAAFYDNVVQQQDVPTVCGDLTFPKESVLSVSEEFKPLVYDISLQRCIGIEKNTQQQAECKEWFQQRKGRLTASIFKKIVKRKKCSAKFIQSVLEQTSVNVAATSYGKANEKHAIEKYIEMTGHHIHSCGLNVNPEFPFLGATPDGKVCINGETGIIEVKCPYSVRDLSIPEAVSQRTDFYLVDEGNGEYMLKEDHEYYYQVQGQLMISGAPFCIFIVYTRKDVAIIRILKNEQFMHVMLDNLCSFYQNYCAPLLTQN